MTNHWIDLKNSDCLFVIGANPAENHPVSFAWIQMALDAGGKLVVVDPRFTRTASKAHLYAPMRSGTDIVFLGGMISYMMERELFHREYVVNYTNAATLINPAFRGPADLDGLFSGFDQERNTYDRSTWSYQTASDGAPLRDETLQNPNCVFQIMRRHYARYTPEMVERVCGTPQDKFVQVCEYVGDTGQPGKAATILYAMGQTQHTVGSQNVRAMGMLQLLLGNVGMPGGGVNALRGVSNVQGSTDMAALHHILPGYLGMVTAAAHGSLKEYNDKETPKTGYWSNKPKFLASLLKAWWGDAATKENDFCFDYLPKNGGNYAWINLFQAMYAGSIKGLLVMGQNPAVSGPNARMERKALSKLEWMVALEAFDTETTSFWRAPGVDPRSIGTEVFLLPVATSSEKSGSLSNSGRLIQWRPQVAQPPGQARPDLWIIDRLYRTLLETYRTSDDPRDRPLLDLVWGYGDAPDPERVAAEINGYWAADVLGADGQVVGHKGELFTGFGQLRDDGTTASGCWIYAGYFANSDDGEGRLQPACKRRGKKDPGGLGIYPNWAFTWPANRRILYNRCSADSAGRPWSPGKALIWWDAEKKQWTGRDVPDFAVTRAPDAAGGKDPFIMRVDGKGAFLSALNEGPLPEHYEPIESPIKNPLSSVQNNPVVKVWQTDAGQVVGDNIGTSDQFPIVCTTYRVVEHWQAGGFSRTLGWLAELQPDMFVEISQELAAEKGIKPGDRVKLSSARGEITCVALVTNRFKPYTIEGRTVHHVGIPWHYGWSGIATGDSANDLTPHVGDGNTGIPEYKAFLVDVRKAEV
jgi:formate dehydrogenase-N alpha subunit